jgi:N-acetylmuramoyl-L-alanine amidase
VIEEMVHDAKGPASPPQAKAEVPKTATPAEAADADDEDLPEPEAPEAPPSRSGPIVRAVNDAVAALTEPEEEPATAAKARELRSTALASHSSLAAQLGLKVRRVVVDAGHGGKDAGAIGPHGVREKTLALAIAKRVAARLKSLGFKVVMTRKDDTFVSLDERTRIANEAHADLFVSIHCNAAKKRNLAGVETWTLNVASDRYAARLAAFENAEADRTVSDLRLILADLATKANAGDARNLAQSVQSSLVRTLRSRVGPVRDHGVKQALFYVLLGTHMPAILVETGFISNPAEEARLKSARFQEGTAEAIARGVKDFVDARRRLALVP